MPDYEGVMYVVGVMVMHDIMVEPHAVCLRHAKIAFGSTAVQVKEAHEAIFIYP